MREGSGMVKFAGLYPERYFDAGIAEQHSVTFAAGLACEGYKPVVAIYSTFLQRAYDQLIHDVQIQNLPVLFAIDRAGLVGADGATHNGSFDLSYLRCLPNMTVMTPSEEMAALPIGRGEIRRKGKAFALLSKKVAILAFGSLLHPALEAAQELDATVANMRFVKPLDEELVAELAASHDLLVTVEENVVMGGAGSAVLEFLQKLGKVTAVLQLGLPDRFIDQGDPGIQLAHAGLNKEGIVKSIRERLAA
jgi:1-deoxy-D-xylulose-5-phosphate synthase